MEHSKLFGVIQVSGADAAKFLQGQLTNDINSLSNQDMIYAAYLNPKGRMLASFIITQDIEKNYLLICPEDIIEYLVKRLRMFVMRSQVVIEPVEYSWVLSEAKLGGAISSFTLGNYCCNLVPPGSVYATSYDFNQLCVEMGVPMIYQASQEQVIPQHVNYDLLGGVNFKKGCYTGQEIVARIHYLGKVKRRMYRFISNVEPVIGSVVTSPLMDNQEVGHIIDYVRCKNQFRGLVSSQIDCMEQLFVGQNHLIDVTEITYNI